MREPERKQIGAHTYIVTPLGAKRGMRLLSRLARIAGPGMTKLATADVKGPRIVGIPVAAIVAAADGILERLADDDLEVVSQMLAESTMVASESGKATKLDPIFDSHFGNAYAELFQWLRFALEVNFGPLFFALRDAAGKPEADPSAETP